MKTESNLEYKVGEVTLGYKRRKSIIAHKRILSSVDSANIFRQLYKPNTIEYKEYFYILLLNNNNDVLYYSIISEGNITESLVDVRIIMQAALLVNATQIILCHNHPSGNLIPSIQDRQITDKIIQAGNIMNIRVLDHIILTVNDYYSFNDNGFM